MNPTPEGEPTQWVPRDEPLGAPAAPVPPHQYQYPQQPYPAPAQVVYVQSPPPARSAIVSLVAGIAGLVAPFCLFFVAPYLWGGASVAGVLAGHFALNDIRADPARVGGRGMAIAGLILSYPVAVAFIVFDVLAAIGYLRENFG